MWNNLLYAHQSEEVARVVALHVDGNHGNVGDGLGWCSFISRISLN